MRPHFRLLATFALLVALAAPARADNTADEADLRFRRGVTAWAARDYEEALSEFFQSNRLVRNRNVLLNIARCYEQLRRYEEAYRYYDEVLGEDPPDEDRAIVEDSLARLAPRLALVRVESDPPGAEIFVDRKDLGARGTTPRTLALPPGPAQVTLSLAGYRDAKETAQLELGRTATVKRKLDFVWGIARVEGTPETAEIRVDTTEGPPAGTVPAMLLVAPGRHVLNVSAPHHLATQVPVEVKGDEEAPVNVSLQRLPDPTGSVVVTANYDGALVTVDGKEAGFTPAFLALPVGAHAIEVTLEDMHPVQQDVVVTKDGRAEVKAELLYAGARTTAASKTETTVDEVPASISVITREEISAFGYTTLAEALRAVRGMFLSADRSYDYLGLRGFSPPGDYNERVLILYDGHPMNELFAGQAFVGREHNVDLNEVERIEVVRGPVSSLFGSNAFFGVINIVPRRNLGGRWTEGGAAAGSQGLARGRATMAVQTSDLDALATVGGLRTLDEGLYVGPPDEGEPTVRGRTQEIAKNGSARLRYGRFTLLANMNDRTKGYEWLTRAAPTEAVPTPTTTRFARNKEDTRAFLEGRFEQDLGGGSGLLARLSYDASRYASRIAYDDGTGAKVLADADWAGLEVRWRSREVLSQRLTAAVEYQRQLRILQQNYESAAGGPLKLQLDDLRRFNVASAWLADELRLGSRVLVNGSVRADDYFDSFGLTVNPRLALITRLVPGGITKLMGGRSFRSPTAFERFYADPVRDPATGEPTGQYATARPSPDLQPETVLTGELEHTQELGRDLRVTGALYVNRLSDLIYTAHDAAGLSVAVNASGTVRTQGAELELAWKPSRFGLLTVAYWYQQLVPSGLDEDQAQRLRANIPAHAFSLKGILPLQPPMLLGSLEAVYNAPRPQLDGSAATGEVKYVALGLSGELPGHGLRYYVGARNLLYDHSPLPATLDGWGVQAEGLSFLAQVAAAY